MNDKLPYEQHLADKLQQLPPPGDVDHRWEQMKALLEKEMPRGGGYGGNGGGGGSGRRWLISLIAGILLIGTWFAREQFQAKHPPGQNTAKVQQPANGSVGNADHANAPAADHQNTPRLPSDNQQENGSKDLASGNPATNPAAGNDLSAPSNKEAAAGRPSIADASGTDRNKHSNEKTIDDNSSTHLKITGNRKISGKDQTAAPASSKGKGKHGKIKPDDQQNNDQADKLTYINNRNNNFSLNHLREAELEASMVSGDWPDFLVAGPELSPSDHIRKYYADGHGLLKDWNSTAKAGSAKAKTQRSVREGSFAIGFSLPMTFPLSDQQAMGYNYKAGPNTVSDYLPSPHVQYHFNSKTFLQTEVQLLSPQYIRPILLYENKNFSPTANAWLINSVYAKKLYYFNLPVSIYHSPLPNFYMGTGLQFSSLIGGVALYEDRKIYGSQETITGERYARFRNDSLSRMMNAAEMRLLLDVNYYWNRFTVGLRYNQAFNNYIAFQLTSTSRYTYDKNKALLFYLRYNLWEDLKRKNNRKPMLTLK